MGEVLFYHLTGASLEATLPDLLEKSLARGWRVLLRAGSEAALAFLDERLWTYRDDAFLPHGRAGSQHDARQPILLSETCENANGAKVLMLTLCARAEVAEMAGFERVCLLFDGAEAEAVAAARADWRRVTAAGLPAKYWANEAGRWTRKAG